MGKEGIVSITREIISESCCGPISITVDALGKQIPPARTARMLVGSPVILSTHTEISDEDSRDLPV